MYGMLLQKSIHVHVSALPREPIILVTQRSINFKAEWWDKLVKQGEESVM